MPFCLLVEVGGRWPADRAAVAWICIHRPLRDPWRPETGYPKASGTTTRILKNGGQRTFGSGASPGGDHPAEAAPVDPSRGGSTSSQSAPFCLCVSGGDWRSRGSPGRGNPFFFFFFFFFSRFTVLADRCSIDSPQSPPLPTPTSISFVFRARPMRFRLAKRCCASLRSALPPCLPP